MIGKTVSHYHIIGELGRGGMGVVYKAEDTKLKRTVALKFLPPELTKDSRAKKRFIQEAQAASALEHSNICTIYEFDEADDGRTFIAMPCYEGEILKDKIQKGFLDIENIMDIVLQICKGLEKAHSKGIVHRDIKPANIFITEDGVVKIVDFGLVKLTGQASITRTGIPLGTVAYMSPEQAQGGQVDGRTDIWSLGVLVYEMLIGELPFKGEYEQAVLYSILNEEFDKNKLLDSHAPVLIQNLIQKALEKNPDHRFQTVEEIHTFLTRNKERIVKSPDQMIFKKRMHAVNSAKRKYLWILIIVILGPLILLFLNRLIRTGITLGPNDYIILADFMNHTEENVFDHSLTEALRVTLLQSTNINILPGDRIQNALEQMRISASKTLDETVALNISRREAVHIVIAGRIDKIGDNFVLSSKIVDTATRETVNIQRVEVTRIEDVLSGMDKLSRKIRKNLGESLHMISRTSEPLESVTTPSLEALELYSRGERLEKQGRYTESIQFKEQAVSIDTLFVMAINDLAYCYRRVGNHKKAVYYHNRLLPIIDRVTKRERFNILTFYYGPFFEQDYFKAFQYARQWISLYPNDALGYATQAHLAFFAGEYDISIQSSKQAMALDSTLTGVCTSNIGYAFALSGDADAALDAFRNSKKIRPDYLTLDAYMAHTYWLKGELDSAEVILQSILTKTDKLQQVRTHGELAALYHFQGQYGRARQECHAGINVCKGLQKPGEESYLHYLLGEIEGDLGNVTLLDNEMEKAILLCRSPYFEVALAGGSYAQHGFKNKALRCIERIRSAESLDPYFIRRKASFKNYIQGKILLADGAFQEAIDAFSQVDKIYSGDPIYWLAQKDIGICKAQSQDKSANIIFENILDHRGEIFMAFLPSIRKGGVWTSRLWPELIVDLGRQYALIGDTTKAVRYLERTQEIWNTADKTFEKRKELDSYLEELSKSR